MNFEEAVGLFLAFEVQIEYFEKGKWFATFPNAITFCEMNFGFLSDRFFW
jgi:hypothetical protein